MRRGGADVANTGQPQGIAPTVRMGVYGATTRDCPYGANGGLWGNHKGLPLRCEWGFMGQPQGIAPTVRMGVYGATTRDCPYGGTQDRELELAPTDSR